MLLPSPTISVGQFTFVGEVALLFWLLISGRRHDFRGQDAPLPARDLKSAER